MKKLLRVSLLTAALLAVLCVSAMAAEGPTSAGMYNIQTATDVTVTPADSEKSSVTVGGTDVTDYYAGAVKFDISATGYDEGEQCLALMVAEGSAITESSIYYIDQASSDGTVNFTIYPKDMGKDHYCVYLVSTSHPYTAETPTAEFDYYVPYKLGDVNDNGTINSTDALWILQAAAEKRTLTSTQALAADVKPDGKINSTDALWVLQVAAEKRTL